MNLRDIKKGTIIINKFEPGQISTGLKLILFADDKKVIFMYIGNYYWNGQVYISKNHQQIETQTPIQFRDDVTIRGYNKFECDDIINEIIENKIKTAEEIIDVLKMLNGIKERNNV